MLIKNITAWGEEMFNQYENSMQTVGYDNPKMNIRQTFKQECESKRAYYQSKLDEIDNLLKLMTPEMEAFVEAMFKVQRG